MPRFVLSANRLPVNSSSWFPLRLQSQAYLPNGYSNAGEDEKEALPQSSLGSLQTAPELAPELLVPPSSEALPPIYPPQDFVPERPVQLHQSSHHGQSLRGDQELSTLPVQGQVVLQRGKGANVEDAQGDSHVYLTKQNGQRPVGKRLRGQPTSELQHPSTIESVGDEEEEVSGSEFRFSFIVRFEFRVSRYIHAQFYDSIAVVRLSRIRACMWNTRCEGTPRNEKQLTPIYEISEFNLLIITHFGKLCISQRNTEMNFR